MKVKELPLLEQKLTRIKIGQRVTLIIAGKTVKKEFTKILKGLIGIIIKLSEDNQTEFN